MSRRVTSAILIACSLALAALAPPPGAWGQLVEDKKGKEEVKTKTAKGTLQSVDSNTLKVASEGQKVLSLRLTSGTKIPLDGKEATLSELKKGQQVTCTYTPGEKEATCLSVAAREDKR